MTSLKFYKILLPFFAIQFFSLFPFCALISSLVLYTSDALHLDNQLTTSIIASFLALNYGLHLFGGVLTGRFFAHRTTLCLALCCQMLGSYFISNPYLTYLYWGLSIFVIGSSVSVTCINCMLTNIFVDESKRETAFFYNYGATNLFALIAFTLSGFLQLSQAYHMLFLLGAGSSGLALIITLLAWKALKNSDNNFAQLKPSQKMAAQLWGALIITSVIILLHWLFSHSIGINAFILSGSILMLIGMIFFGCQQKKPNVRLNIFYFILLALAGLVFWSLYQLVPIILTIFIQNNIRFHTYVPPQWLRGINPLTVIIGAPLISSLLNRYRRSGKTISICTQFSFALILMGISLLILKLGIYYANNEGYTQLYWIVICFMLQSLGEIFIAPVGYAMIGELAPNHLRPIFMGTWLMLNGTAAVIAGYLSNYILTTAHSLQPLISNSIYSYTFNILGLTGVVVGCSLLLIGRCLPKPSFHLIDL